MIDPPQIYPAYGASSDPMTGGRLHLLKDGGEELTNVKRVVIEFRPNEIARMLEIEPGDPAKDEKCADCGNLRQDGATWFEASCIAPDGSRVTHGFCNPLQMDIWLETHNFENDPECVERLRIEAEDGESAI